MGSGGKAHELLNLEAIEEDALPVIRRFTGGGTVLVNEKTMFVSFVGSHQFLKQFGMRCSRDGSKIWNQPFPTDMMHWTAEFYRPIFTPSLSSVAEDLRFDLLENDYVFVRSLTENNQAAIKFAGNAQYMTGGMYKRFTHHTSFLWDHSPELMSRYLSMPSRRPKYRETRDHGSFLTNLNQVQWKAPERYSRTHKVNSSISSPSSSTLQPKATIVENPFLEAVVHRVHELCETDWMDHVAEVREYRERSQVEELWEQFMSRENKYRRNNYYYHPDRSLQEQHDLLNID